MTMNYEEKDLNLYAATGLRTPQAWAALGREVQAGAQPRTQARRRTETVPLFTRDQTRAVRRDR